MRTAIAVPIEVESLLQFSACSLKIQQWPCIHQPIPPEIALHLAGGHLNLSRVRASTSLRQAERMHILTANVAKVARRLSKPNEISERSLAWLSPLAPIILNYHYNFQ